MIPLPLRFENNTYQQIKELNIRGTLLVLLSLVLVVHRPRGRRTGFRVRLRLRKRVGSARNLTPPAYSQVGSFRQTSLSKPVLVLYALVSSVAEVSFVFE